MILSSKKKLIQKNIIETAKRMNSCGINQGTSGNLSVRYKDGILITPSSIPYEKLKVSDILHIGLNGIPINDSNKKLNPSSEWRFHADIMKKRSDVNAIMHCHSIYATALACHQKSIPSFHYMTAIAGGEDIKCCEYATFGTKELSNNVINSLQGRFACLLAHHGQITIGRTLEEVLMLSIEVETLAKMYLIACHLGEPKHLCSHEMDNVLIKFKEIGYK